MFNQPIPTATVCLFLPIFFRPISSIVSAIPSYERSSLCVFLHQSNNHTGALQIQRRVCAFAKISAHDWYDSEKSFSLCHHFNKGIWLFSPSLTGFFPVFFPIKKNSAVTLSRWYQPEPAALLLLIYHFWFDYKKENNWNYKIWVFLFRVTGYSILIWYPTGFNLAFFGVESWVVKPQLMRYSFSPRWFFLLSFCWWNSCERYVRDVCGNLTYVYAAWLKLLSFLCTTA